MYPAPAAVTLLIGLGAGFVNCSDKEWARLSGFRFSFSATSKHKRRKPIDRTLCLVFYSALLWAFLFQVKLLYGVC